MKVELKFSKQQKLKSYFEPLLIEATSSKFNPKLEVNLYHGKLVLDADVANFSFGALHEVFQIAFRKLNLKNLEVGVSPTSPLQALILGFGGGSVASILTEELKLNCRITGIEIDEKIIDLRKKYFEPEDTSNIELIIGDAFDLSLVKNKKFDLIVCDVFNDISVPKELETQNYFEQIKNLLNPNGLFVFNKVVENFKKMEKFSSTETIFENVFKKNKSFKVLGVNKILCGWNS